MLRSALKRILEPALAYGGPASLMRRHTWRRPVVLAYHNVLPDNAVGGGDMSLHLSAGLFKRHLDVLESTHDIVPLSELLATTERREKGRRPRAVVTLDDAYYGALTVAVPELARRGLPATVFVAPEFVGRRSFWWDVIAVNGKGLTHDARALALARMEGRDSAIRKWATESGVPLREVGPFAMTATEEELQEAVANPGITLGSHTWSHPNLTALTEEAVREELTRPLAWLRDRFGESVIPWIAYPYGLCSPMVERIAESSGYRAGLLVAGGRIPKLAVNRFALPRVNVPARLSEAGLVLRTSGVLG